MMWLEEGRNRARGAKKKNNMSPETHKSSIFLTHSVSFKRS